MSLDLLFEPSDAAPVFEPASPAPSPERAAHAASPEKGTAATEPSRRPILAASSGVASPAPSRTRIARNIEAVMVAKELEREGREATPEEAARMLSFVGWGGLAEVFDETSDAYAAERERLKAGLTEREYAKARESTLTAYYTPIEVARAVWDYLAMAGFSAGNVLDPAAGTGRFAEAMPEGMAGLASITMVEPDPVSALIAQHAHPGMAVQCKGYEATTLADDSFDVAVTNVPFGQFSVLVHDYFFAKSLDHVRPGGLVAFITASGTLDKKSSSARRELAARAELVCAARLPDSTFRASAGTTVTSDVVVLRKRHERISNEEAAGLPWVGTVEHSDGVRVNRWIAEHREAVLGELEVVSGPYGPQLACKGDWAEAAASLAGRLMELASGSYEERPLPAARGGAAAADLIEADPSVPDGCYGVVDGALWYREGDTMRLYGGPKSQEARIRALAGLRDLGREYLALQSAGADDEPIESARTAFKAAYERLGATPTRRCCRRGRIPSTGSGSRPPCSIGAPSARCRSGARRPTPPRRSPCPSTRSAASTWATWSPYPGSRPRPSAPASPAACTTTRPCRPW